MAAVRKVRLRTSNVAAHFGIDYQAHDAFEDARCAGLLLLRAIAETGLTTSSGLRAQSNQSISPATNTRSASADPMQKGRQTQKANSSQVVVSRDRCRFIARMPADSPAAAGCRVDDGVTKHTTCLSLAIRIYGCLLDTRKAQST